MAFVAVSNMLDDWHERLGHVSREAILKLVDMVDGLTVTEGGHLGEDCEPCALSKYHQCPFEEVNRHSEEPLQLVFSDLCGNFTLKHLEAVCILLHLGTIVPDCVRFIS